MDICNITNILQLESKLIDGCILSTKYLSINDTKAREYCSYKYTLTHIEANTLRNRLVNYVHQMQYKIHKEYGLKIISYDQYKWMNKLPNVCDYTKDRIHYAPILPVLILGIFLTLRLKCQQVFFLNFRQNAFFFKLCILVSIAHNFSFIHHRIIVKSISE